MIDQVGTVRAHTLAQVSSRIMAQVKEILVREGDVVVVPMPGGVSPAARRRRIKQSQSTSQSSKGGAADSGSGTVLARLDDGEIWPVCVRRRPR
jgi:hypothetical protein